MKYIKKYNKLFEWRFHDDFHKEKIRDVNYYIDKIKSEDVDNNSIEQLFHWSCTYNFPELALALVDLLGYQIVRLHRSIAYLEYNTFKKIIEKNDLYKRLEVVGKGSTEFISEIIYYGGKDSVKKLKLLKKLGYEINKDTLRIACYGNNLEVIKYLVSLGFDPKEKEKTSYSDRPQNCLDIATNYGKDNYDVIKYLVKDLKIPVTYRHMHNVINKDKKALEFLVKSDNIIDDYAYSSWSTHDEDKKQYTLRDILSSLAGKGRMDLFKYLVDKEDIKDKYNFVFSLNTKRDWKGFDEGTNTYIKPDQLDMAYYLFKQSKIEPYIGVVEFVMNNNEDYWYDKFRKDPELFKMINPAMPYEHIKKYKYQKILFDSGDKEFINHLIKFYEKDIDEKILKEFSDMPEIMDIILKKYNL